MRFARIGWTLVLAATVWAAGCNKDTTEVAADVVAPVDAVQTDEIGQVPAQLCDSDPAKLPDGCVGCHGMPPTAKNHPPNTRCWRCHGNTVDRDFKLVNAKLHQNGKVDVSVGCSSCHGWSLGVSPPSDLTGDCTAGTRSNGAHLAMRKAALPVHQVACSNCHPVPAALKTAGHNDGKIDVVFAELAVVGGAKPTWDGEKCNNVYCHGATLKGGTLTNPTWTDTTHAASKCGACHALATPDGKTGVDCSACHPTTVGKDGQILPRGTHLNGVVDTAVGGALTRNNGGAQ